jgi:hypothetical protein
MLGHVVVEGGGAQGHLENGEAPEGDVVAEAELDFVAGVGCVERDSATYDVSAVEGEGELDREEGVGVGGVLADGS